MKENSLFSLFIYNKQKQMDRKLSIQERNITKKIILLKRLVICIDKERI